MSRSTTGGFTTKLSRVEWCRVKESNPLSWCVGPVPDHSDIRGVMGAGRGVKPQRHIGYEPRPLSEHPASVWYRHWELNPDRPLERRMSCL